MDGSAGRTAGRLSWEQAHRLELTLRARADRLAPESGPARCPGCGKPVSAAEDHLRLAGHVLHAECLGDDALL